MKKKLYDELTNLYPIQKTLRFSLIPQGKTRDWLTERQIIGTDEHMAESYKIIKKMIDCYHKKVIAESLEMAQLSEVLLDKYKETVRQADDLDDIELALRKEVAGVLASHHDFKKLFGKEMVLEQLPKIAETNEEYQAIQEFARFTSYLTNYHDIRKNLYSKDKKEGTVAYRLIHENLPKHLGNTKVYEKICSTDVDIYSEIRKLEEFLGDIDLGNMFNIYGFNQVLSQKGIDRYNQVINGVATETGKLKGLNEIINLWNQQQKKDENGRKHKLPRFTPLYKQMMSDRDTQSFVIDAFEKDDEVFDALKASCIELEEIILSKTNCSVMEVYKDLSQYDTSEIYVRNDGLLTDLSNKVFGSWDVLLKGISEDYDRNYMGKKKPGTEKYEEEKKKALKKEKSYSLATLQKFADNAGVENKVDITQWLEAEAGNIIDDIRVKKDILSGILEDEHRLEKPLNKDGALVGHIKDYLDSIKKLQRFLMLLQGDGMEPERDERFYGDYAYLTDSLFKFNSLYNKTRNYVTKRPFSVDKIKLNFNCPTLFNGWDLNQESKNLGVLFKKGNNYYLGVMENNKAFRDAPEADDSVDCYEKLEYKLLPGPNKMLPKVFFSNGRMDEFAPSEEILKIYRTGTFKKGKTFSLEDCHKLIDFFKASIEKHEDWKKFDFQFAPTESYRDISEFYKEIADQGYKITMKKISTSYIDELVETGQLYLFQIYNQDFSEYSKGKLNLHTIYWHMLFDERNLENVVYKLNGEAEIFYRMPSLDLAHTVIHKANESIENKNPLNPKKTSTFDYDIIKNKRYTQEKFLFHVPVTINFKCKDTWVNTVVNKKLKEIEEYYVIGIDRGERNLLYAVVINHKGEIVEKQQISLNVVNNVYSYKEEQRKQEVNYHELLDMKEKERDKARKSWTSVEQIKDLKSGYLSQVVHVITQLAVKYNALIVMEDLNTGFKRGRQKIEKQVYQNFEKALIQKLNFLVIDKERTLTNVQEAGGALAAYQLTNQFESFSKLGKQSGVLLYVDAWCTSQIDPTTGFVNILYPSYINLNKSKEYFAKFNGIRYNPEKDYFEFAFNYANFTEKAEGTRTDWVVCTYGERIRQYRDSSKNNSWSTMSYSPTIKLKELLESKEINYVSGNALKEDILNQKDAAFFKELTMILKMTLQMRNSSLPGDEENKDYIQSCVMNDKGEFFNSEKATEEQPKDADANGAYNIARKGLLLVNKIRNQKEDEKLELYVKHKEWLQFAQKNHC